MSRDNYVNLTRGNIQAIAGAVNARRAAERAALKTTNKGSYVAAINELFDAVDEHIAPKTILVPMTINTSEDIGCYAIGMLNSDNVLFLVNDTQQYAGLKIFVYKNDTCHVLLDTFCAPAISKVIVYNDIVYFLDEDKLYRYNDANETLSVTNVGLQGSLVNINGQRAIITGDGHATKYTDDAGATWHQIPNIATGVNTGSYNYTKKISINSEDYTVLVGSSPFRPTLINTTNIDSNPIIPDTSKNIFNIDSLTYYNSTTDKYEQYVNSNMVELVPVTPNKLTTHSFKTSYSAIIHDNFTVNVSDYTEVYETAVVDSWQHVHPIYIFVGSDKLCLYDSYLKKISILNIAINTSFGMFQLGVACTAEHVGDTSSWVYDILIYRPSNSISDISYLKLDVSNPTYGAITSTKTSIQARCYKNNYANGTHEYSNNSSIKLYTETTSGGGATIYKLRMQEGGAALPNTITVHSTAQTVQYYAGATISSYTPASGDTFVYDAAHQWDAFDTGDRIYVSNGRIIQVTSDNGSTWTDVTGITDILTAIKDIRKIGSTYYLYDKFAKGIYYSSDSVSFVRAYTTSDYVIDGMYNINSNMYAKRVNSGTAYLLNNGVTSAPVYNATLPIVIGSDTIIVYMQSSNCYISINGTAQNVPSISDTDNNDGTRILEITNSGTSIGSYDFILDSANVLCYVDGSSDNVALTLPVQYRNPVMLESMYIPMFCFDDYGDYTYMLTDSNGNIITDAADIDTKAAWAYCFPSASLCEKYKVIEYNGHKVPSTQYYDEYYDPANDTPVGEFNPSYTHAFRGSLFDLINYCRYS